MAVAAAPPRELTKDRAVWIYERMTKIRAFEDRVAKLFADGKIPGFVHLYAGEEAVAVGVCAHLDDSDYTTIGGLLFGALGRLPKVGDTIAFKGAVFEILEMDGRRVGSVRLIRQAAEA